MAKNLKFIAKELAHIIGRVLHRVEQDALDEVADCAALKKPLVLILLALIEMRGLRRCSGCGWCGGARYGIVGRVARERGVIEEWGRVVVVVVIDVCVRWCVIAELRRFSIEGEEEGR